MLSWSKAVPADPAEDAAMEVAKAAQRKREQQGHLQ